MMRIERLEAMVAKAERLVAATWRRGDVEAQLEDNRVAWDRYTALVSALERAGRGR